MNIETNLLDDYVNFILTKRNTYFNQITKKVKIFLHQKFQKREISMLIW